MTSSAIFAEISAQDFVSVQPMNLPSGLVFYLDFKYGSASAHSDKGVDVFGDTSSSGDPTGGLYGAGKYQYSTAVSSSDIVDPVVGTLASLKDINFDADISASGIFS